MYLGDFNTGVTIRGQFNTRTAAGTPITLAGTPALSVYKDGGTTESTTGVTLTVDFDSRTGLHLFAIDTSADGAFYSAGSDFRVVLTAGTVDSVSVVGAKVGEFSLLNRSALRPTVAGRTLDVSSTGEAGIDLANVGSPTTTLNLSGTTIKAVTDAVALPASASINITGNITGNLSGSVGSVTGAVGSVTGNVGGNVVGSVGSISGVSFPSNFSTLAITVGGAVTAGTVSDKTGYSLASGGLAAVTTWTVAITGNITGNLSGSVGSVTGAVGSVTGNVGGNVVGSVGSISGVTFPSNFASMAITVGGAVTVGTNNDKTGYTTDAFSGGALIDISAITDILSTTDLLGSMIESNGAGQYRFDTIALSLAPSGSGPSAADIADAVWDEAIASHLTAGSTGAALNAAGGAGDPWITTLPGGYTGDQAGAILDAIRDKTALITGSDMFIAVDRVTNGTITMYKNEATSVTVPLSEDTTSKTLRFTVEDAYGTDILTIANASITRTSSTFTVTIPATVTDELANHTWALRDVTGGINRLVRKGVLTVQAAADNDA